MTRRLSSSELAAIREGTDQVARRLRHRMPLAGPELAADLPPEVSDEHASRGDWQDDYPLDVVEDRTLTDDLPPGYDPRCWTQGLGS